MAGDKPQLYDVPIKFLAFYTVKLKFNLTYKKRQGVSCRFACF